MGQLPPEVEFVHVSKRFGQVQANDDVSFAVRRGSLHGIAGENGAGKSTIMKALYGLHSPDSGEIRLRGEPVAFSSPLAAIRFGIGMVHQHFMLVPTLTVWENIVLGREPGRLVIDRQAARDRISRLASQFGFGLDLEAKIEELSVGEQQQVEILKLLYREASVLVLDEPTAVLTPQEVDGLFERLRALKDQGRTILLITHKLREILAFTERVTVMRQGKVVGTFETTTLDEKSLAGHIVGRPPAPPIREAHAPSPSPRLVVKGLRVRGTAARARLDGIDLEVRGGEILGIAGVEGNGQAELVEVLSLVRKDYEGEVSWNGKPLKGLRTYAAKQTGLSIIPSDRHREAVVLSFSVGENLLLGHHREEAIARRGWISPGRVRALAEPLLERFDVRPRRSDVPIASLSGGNQQKAVIARELARKASLIIAAHPTRGVDVGAIEFIHRVFLEQRRAGAAIVLVSSELEELIALSDRILVLYEGRVMGEIAASRATEGQLGCWMTGATGSTGALA